MLIIWVNSRIGYVYCNGMDGVLQWAVFKPVLIFSKAPSAEGAVRY